MLEDISQSPHVLVLLHYPLSSKSPCQAVGIGILILEKLDPIQRLDFALACGNDRWYRFSPSGRESLVASILAIMSLDWEDLVTFVNHSSILDDDDRFFTLTDSSGLWSSSVTRNETWFVGCHVDWM